jgi:hypothetical protein
MLQTKGKQVSGHATIQGGQPSVPNAKSTDMTHVTVTFSGTHEFLSKQVEFI